MASQLQLNVSPFLSSDESRFFMHVFNTETAPRLFPAAPHIFLHRMVSAAVETPCLLYALLASACSHHSRLIQDRRPQSRMARLKFTNMAISGLRAAIMNSSGTLNAEMVTTAMALCTNDLCNGHMDVWRTHLRGVMRLLAILLTQGNSTEADDAYLLCLVKWFTTMDVLAGLSGIHSSCFSDELNVSLSQTSSQSNGVADEVCGYSLELVPILTRISQLVHSRDMPGIIDHGVPPDVMKEAHVLESKLDALVHGSVLDATTVAYPSGLRIELERTHLAFAHSALLHLHRRVQMLPQTHPKVITDISNILDAFTHIQPFSPANILVLWPLFSAGCETTDRQQQAQIQERMSNMQSFGLGNFTRAKQHLTEFWASHTDLPWDVYFAQLGVELVLF
ncbi:hypothetical protein FE257_011358 [Aspergillus nanangensis]|uniref:Uncharacterized protein n=1 Tax=Aspergillus nanangensis TaxID=2582783 RepID=A0AAD4GRI5_ASPNN|nr:hypothetical protein FE257_011358 [Aspergillus nanangensis]